jgi:hypothetical protein
VPTAYATREFTRGGRKQGIDREGLCEAAARAERGIVDADLRRGLIKQRVPRKGSGRRGGFRVLAAFRAGHRCVFLYSFAKSERENISGKELYLWQKTATAYLDMSVEKLKELVGAGELHEVRCDE